MDNKVNAYIEKGYDPAFIKSMLDDEGIELTPEEVKELYYKCGYEYDIETGGSHRIEKQKEGVLLSVDELIKKLEEKIEFYAKEGTLAQEKLDKFIEEYDNYNWDMEENDTYIGLQDRAEYFEIQLNDLYEVLEEVKEKKKNY